MVGRIDYFTLTLSHIKKETMKKMKITLKATGSDTTLLLTYYCNIDLSCTSYAYTRFFYKNNFIRTRASDFVKIKNNFRTIEPRTNALL